jgi:hypothetical protein
MHCSKTLSLRRITMAIKLYRRLAFVTICGCFLGLSGCAETEPYEVEKPVLEDDDIEVDGLEDERLEYEDDTLGEDIGETIDDAADAVTPDENVVDIDTPIGDVDVEEDPATGRTRVDVDSDGDEQ